MFLFIILFDLKTDPKLDISNEEIFLPKFIPYNSDKIFQTSNLFGFLAIILAAVNIFGGFLVTQRMLQMYKKRKK